MPKLKLKVEYAIIGYLIGELTDEEFKERIQAILDEFRGKNLLHKNIGQLAREWEKRNRAMKTKFEKIWILLEQVRTSERTWILRKDVEIPKKGEWLVILFNTGVLDTSCLCYCSSGQYRSRINSSSDAPGS